MSNQGDTSKTHCWSAIAREIRRGFTLLAIAVTTVAFFSSASARGDVVLEGHESDTARGHFNQLAQENGMYLLPNPTQDCGPTSVGNSFVYLQDQGITGLGGADAGSGPGYAAIGYDTISTLDGYMGVDPNNGVNTQGFVEGKENYLMSLANDGYGIRDANGNQVAIQTVGQSAPTLGGYQQAANGPWIGGVSSEIPTADFIEQQLADGEDVEMLFGWADADGNLVGGGHWVNVYGIDFNETENQGSIAFIDPENSVNGVYTNGTGDAPAIESLSLEELLDGYLAFGYKGGASGIPADDDPTGAAYGDIVSVIAESPVPVPEPGSLVLAGLGFLALCRRRAKTSS